MGFGYLMFLLVFWCLAFHLLFLCALASRDELQSRKIKLDYDEVGTCQKDVINVWDKKLLNCRAKIRCDMEDIHSTLKEGMHVGWLLTMKSEDFFWCVCEVAFWYWRKSGSSTLFPVAQNNEKMAFSLQMHPPPAARQKTGSAVSTAYSVSKLL